VEISSDAGSLGLLCFDQSAIYSGEGFFGQFMLGNISDHANDSKQLAVLIEVGPAVALDSDHRAVGPDHAISPL
jgi:hypothetical protein